MIRMYIWCFLYNPSRSFCCLNVYNLRRGMSLSLVSTIVFHRLRRRRRRRSSSSFLMWMSRPLDFLRFLWEDKMEDVEEEEAEDELYLLLFLLLCLDLGWSLLLGMFRDVCLLDSQVLVGGSISILGSNMVLKYGSNGSSTLCLFLEFEGSFVADCRKLICL